MDNRLREIKKIHTGKNNELKDGEKLEFEGERKEDFELEVKEKSIGILKYFNNMISDDNEKCKTQSKLNIEGLNQSFDESENIEKNTLSANFNLKDNMNIVTPTFHGILENRLSWEDLPQLKADPNYSKIDILDISNIEKDSRSGGLGTYSELPTLLDANPGNSDKSQDFEESQKNECKEIQVNVIVCETPAYEEEPCMRNNETIVFEDTKKEAFSIKSNSRLKKKLLFKGSSMPSFNKRGHNKSQASEIKKQSKRSSLKPSQKKIYLKTEVTSPEASKKSLWNTKLPQIKDKKKQLTANPYLSDWGRSHLRSLYNVELKFKEDGGKALISRIVKKKNRKIL